MNAYVIAVLTVLAVAVAEPPRYRQKFQRQEAAPYPASGWRPAGAEFRLPSRVQNLPQIYGPPSTETETEAVTTDFPETTTTVEPEAQKLKEKLVNEKENEAEEVEVENSQQPQQQGIYYILLPSGQLSKVQYVTNGDLDAAYTAQLQYQEVPPINGPIYAFGPNGQVIQIL